MMTLRAFIALLLIVAGAAPAMAATAYQFQHYTSADGLPSNCIRDIIQDEDGFIWLATDGGLSRFDGVSFKNFVPGDAAPGITNDPFVSSMAISNHRLWMATINGVLVYDSALERLVCPELNYEEGCPEIEGFITGMDVCPAGCLWIASANGRIYRIDEELNVRSYDMCCGKGAVNTVYVDKRGDVWITGSQNQPGLYKYNADHGRFECVAVEIGGKNVEITSRALAEDSRNRIWMGMSDGSLLCMNPFTASAEQISLRGKTDMGNIQSITPVGASDLYIGNDFGVVVYNFENGSCYAIRHDELQPASLSGQFVYPIVCDAEGGVWIGTFYAGLNYLQPDIKRFESSRHSRFVNSVSGNIISSFCEDARGNIYIGSEDGGVCRYDKASDTYANLVPAWGVRPSVNVHTLCMDGDELWAGTYSNGILVFDSRTGRQIRDMSAVKRSDGGNITMCYTIRRDKQGDMWIASNNEILKYDRKADKFQFVKNLNAWTTDIKEDQAGRLWFSTQGQGLYRYDRHNDEWKQYKHETGNPNSLSYDHVACVDFDNRGTMWAATGNGLARYRAESDDFESVSVEDANAPLQFVKAVGDNLWIGTGNGLVRYEPLTGESTHFSIVEGLPDNQFANSAVFEDSEGVVYAGTINGYTRFVPSQIGTNVMVPPLFFTSLDVLGRHVDVGDPRLPQSLNSIDCLELGPDDNAFSIAFAALSYVNPGNNNYMYKLDGFDKEWMTSDGSNRASYTNLAPGNYTLRVKASNNDKVWNEAGISLPIHIAPRWYNEWWMRAIYVLIVGCGVFAMLHVFAQRSRRKHAEEMERLKTVKEMEVYQSKVNFFTTIAHEIRTPVSLIIGPLESIMKSRSDFSETQNEDFDIIHRNTQRLLFLINQLLDFRKVENLAVEANFFSTDIPALVKSVAERFRPTFNHRGITLVVHLPAEPFKADVDAEALTKLVSNLLNNARKFTRSLVEVACGISADGQSFTIQVTDDGVGISESDMKRIFQPFVQVGANEEHEGGTGLGLSIVRHVVTAHSGKIEVKSHPGDGSTFVVAMPVHQQGVAHPGDIIEEDAGRASTALPKQEADDKANDNDMPVMLIVDDNPDLLRFLHNYFSKTYTVISATDAFEAIKHMERCNVDLIVSDWMMPGMSGVDFCRKVRDNRDTSHIPFILLTAKTDEPSKIEGLNCGADAYIEKPFSIDYLAARITNLLALRHMLKQKFTAMPLESIETLAANPVDNQFLAQLTKLIEDNFSNPELTVDFLCQNLGISRSGLYAKVRTLTDSTPNELIQITRLKRAAQLLSEHRYRVNEICYMVGFSNPSYFAKCFQRQFGMKPNEFKG